MTAWDELVRFSSLAEGDAWGHLTHQQGGGTVEKTVLLVNVSDAGLSDLPVGGDVTLAYLQGNFSAQALAAGATPAQLSGTIAAAGLAADLASVDLIAGAMDAPTEGVIYGD